MKVTKVEILRNKDPIPLPNPWRAAWREPSGKPITTLEFLCYKVYTDEGIVGIGPYTGANPALVQGIDPFQVGAFWDARGDLHQGSVGDADCRLFAIRAYVDRLLAEVERRPELYDVSKCVYCT